MSIATPQSKRKGGEQETKNAELGIDPRYTVVDEHDGEGHLGRVVDPFIDMVYPLNRDNDLDEGVIEGGGPHRVVQRPDGSGVIESSTGARTYGVRLTDGTVIGDSSGLWFPYRSDYHIRRDDNSGEVDYRDTHDWFFKCPFQFIREMVDEFLDMDLEDQKPTERASYWETFVRGLGGCDILDHETEYGALLTHRSGVQMYIGFDSTSKAGNDLFGFVPFDGSNGVPVPSAKDALDLLTPNEAAADSSVVRQGEFFFVPTTEDADGTIQKPGVSSKEWRYTAPRVGEFGTRHEAIGEMAKEFGAENIITVSGKYTYPVGSPMDSHIPREWRAIADDDTFVTRFVTYAGVTDVETPQDVVNYVYENEDEFPETVYADIRDMADGIQVRGSLRHRDQDHGMEMVDEWRAATTHDWTVLSVDTNSSSPNYVHLDC